MGCVPKGLFLFPMPYYQFAENVNTRKFKEGRFIVPLIVPNKSEQLTWVNTINKFLFKEFNVTAQLKIDKVEKP